MSIFLHSSFSFLLFYVGKLDSVGNLSTTSIMDDHFSISVSWTPPHSLANIPINYTLTVTGQLYGYSSSQVTTDTLYIIELPDLCDNYWLIVMATNTAGHGNNNTLIIYQMEGKQLNCMANWYSISCSLIAFHIDN